MMRFFKYLWHEATGTHDWHLTEDAKWCQGCGEVRKR